MDYEKKYKEALERARSMYESRDDAELAAFIFPELTESEDERILRVISEAVITFFSDYANDFEDEDRDAALAWLEKQKEQKPADYNEYKMLMDGATEDGKIKGRKEVIEHPEKYGLTEQKPEWSEEDEEMIDIVLTMVDCSTVVPHSGGQLHPSDNYKKDISNWLKSLRPSWKPSEEQMAALEAATVRYQSTGLESLYEDLKKVMKNE